MTVLFILLGLATVAAAIYAVTRKREVIPPPTIGGGGGGGGDGDGDINDTNNTEVISASDKTPRAQ